MPRQSCNRCFCFSLFVIFIILISFVIYMIVFLSIFAPQELKLTVSDASLTKFDYNSTGNNTLFYNMALNITIRNPNKRIGLYYNRIQALSQYGKKRFSVVTLTNSTPFYQGHKNTTVVNAFIEGQQVLLFKEMELTKYNTETIAGVYSVEVKLALRVKLRYGNMFKTPYYKPEKLICKLKLPLVLQNSVNGSTASTSIMFKPTRCDNIYVVVGRPIIV